MKSHDNGNTKTFVTTSPFTMSPHFLPLKAICWEPLTTESLHTYKNIDWLLLVLIQLVLVLRTTMCGLLPPTTHQKAPVASKLENIADFARIKTIPSSSDDIRGKYCWGTAAGRPKMDLANPGSTGRVVWQKVTRNPKWCTRVRNWGFRK